MAILDDRGRPSGQSRFYRVDLRTERGRHPTDPSGVATGRRGVWAEYGLGGGRASETLVYTCPAEVSSSGAAMGVIGWAV